MPQNLPTDLLRSFVTVAEMGSITTAGEMLGRSQPAISLQIKRLEDSLNVSLFQRGKRQFNLTVNGKILFEYAQKILLINDEAIQHLTQPFLKGHVHLGIPNEFAISFLPAVLRRYASTHAEVQVTVSCDLSVNLKKRLECGEFDCVLALDDAPQDSDTTLSWDENIVWIGAERRAITQKEPVSLIVAPEGCIYRARAIAALDEASIPWRIAYTSANYSGIHAGVSAGLGITATAKSTVVSDLEVLGRAEKLPALAGAHMTLSFDKKHSSPAAMSLIDHIVAHVKPRLRAASRAS